MGQYWHQHGLLVSLLQHGLFLCYNIRAYVYLSWNALVLVLFDLMC